MGEKLIGVGIITIFFIVMGGCLYMVLSDSKILKVIGIILPILLAIAMIVTGVIIGN